MYSEQLAQMSETDIYDLEGTIGYENVKTLLTARDNILKSEDHRKAYSIGKEVRESLIDKAYGAKTIINADTQEKKDRINNMRYFLQTEELIIINGLIASGIEPTPERIMQDLETALLQKRTVEVPGLLWGVNEAEKYLAELPPWQQEQYRAAERMALKVKTGQAIGGHASLFGESVHDVQPFDFGGDGQSDSLGGLDGHPSSRHKTQQVDELFLYPPLFFRETTP